MEFSTVPRLESLSQFASRPTVGFLIIVTIGGLTKQQNDWGTTMYPAILGKNTCFTSSVLYIIYIYI